MRGGLISALIGLVLSGIALAMSPQRTAFAYLAAYEWAVSLVLGALIFVFVCNVMRARWSAVIRRVPESIAATLPMWAALFIPIALGARLLYLWTAPAAELGPELSEQLAHKAAWLNLPAFIIRAVVYLAAWIVFALILRAWSVRQDSDGDPRWTLKLRYLSGAGIPVLALTLTFAAFDWFMSLTPQWISAVYGVYIFAGGFQASFALVMLILRRLEVVGALAGKINPSHYHALGKLLFSFTVFWAYIAFSQYFIVWIGNLPEETIWWAPRSLGWGWVSILLVLSRFVLPFFLLLPRDVKRSGRLMSGISWWVLAAHFVDAYWLVLPTLNPEGPRPHLADAGTLLLLGGLGAMAIAWVMRRAAPVATGDPGLPQSLRYTTL